MIKKSLSVILSSVYVLSLLIMTGCADDLRNRSVFDCGAGDAVISFSVENISATRAGNSYDFESNIDHAYLLFYSASASLENDKPLAAVRAEIDNNNPGTLKFKIPLRLTPDTDYQLLAVANADHYLPSGFDTFGDYLDSWCRDIESSGDDILLLSNQSPITPDTHESLPMICRMDSNSPFRFSMDNGSYKVSTSLRFQRMVARIDVANIVKEDFFIEGVALCNWRDAVPVSASVSQLGNRFGNVQGILSGENLSETELNFIEMPEPDESGVQQLKESIYCFPSVAYDSYIGDLESTALIIEAKYKDDTQSSYYRVNINMRANRSEVKPNTKYLVTIQSVRGRGESTPEEAYAAKESLIVLSVVEDWDLEGNTFAMDDYGNFIVVSRGSIDFEADAANNVEVRILTSKGLSWSAEYIADNDASALAFNVDRLSDMAISIGTKAENSEDSPLSGKCRVSAITDKGNQLAVDIILSQKVAEEHPYEPVIPTDKPFAIIPLDGERVKIDHDKQTIEIDGFDPNCFNSFIDIPFRVYVNDSETDISAINISSTLEWPLEGRISTDISLGYTYCKESFAAKGAGQVYSSVGNLTKYNELYKSSISIEKDENFYISIGAMGPDDPAIESKITIEGKNKTIIYSLIIKPCSAIIDDVILKDNSNKYWVIQDRNVQDSSNVRYVDAKGDKCQAYNYSYSQTFTVTIPYKFCNLNSVMNESYHSMYKGCATTFKNRNDMSNLGGVLGKRYAWLKKIIDIYVDKKSPFYEQTNYEDWIIPDDYVIEIMRRNLKVTKMRMFLVSDIKAKSGNRYLPICCYLPYSCFQMGDLQEFTYGYFISEDGEIPISIKIFYFDITECHAEVPNPLLSNFNCLTRLVRPLTSEELDNYKKNYLGYGSEPHKLTICHPDTYDSEGWLPY